MANNHGMDYGPAGLEDSLTAKASSGFPVIGIGHNAAEAYAPFRTEIKGQRIAVIGATQVLDDNLITAWTATDAQGGLASAKDVPRLVAAVQEARATSDTVVVFLHWGVEQQTCPSASQQQLARALVDAGADIVVGSHAHRLQGAGRLDAAFVGYGLGNFAFYTRSGPGTETGRAQGHRDRAATSTRYEFAPGRHPRRRAAAARRRRRGGGDERVERPARLHRPRALRSTTARALRRVRPCSSENAEEFGLPWRGDADGRACRRRRR